VMLCGPAAVPGICSGVVRGALFGANGGCPVAELGDNRGIRNRPVSRQLVTPEQPALDGW
jgi:hypothetical protein